MVFWAHMAAHGHSPKHRGVAAGERLHKLDCQVWYACDKPYMETLVACYYNVPVIWVVVFSTAGSIRYEQNLQ
jgi:hypothetical protein